MKAKIYGGKDPNFLIMYLREEDQEGVTNAVAATDAGDGATDAANGPIKCSAVLNVGRDDDGFMKSWRAKFLLIFYCLSNLGRLGLRGAFDLLKVGFTQVQLNYVRTHTLITKNAF